MVLQVLRLVTEHAYMVAARADRERRPRTFAAGVAICAAEATGYVNDHFTESEERQRM